MPLDRRVWAWKTEGLLLHLGSSRSGRAEWRSSKRSPLAAQSLLRASLLDTVQHHLIADVPVGFFLSSGIDSTTLTALAAQVGGTLRTVTLGFDEFRGTDDDEVPLAEEVARSYGTRHETIWLTRDDFEQVP